MNKIKHLVNKATLLIACFSLAGCSDFLDVKPYGQKLPDTNDDFEQLLVSQLRAIDVGNDEVFGSYKQMLKYECYSDNLNASQLTSKPNNMPIYVGEDIGGTQYRFRKVYPKIRDLNIILGNMPDKDSEKGREMVAVCHAMRGAMYFVLMRESCEPYNATDPNSVLGLPLVSQFDIEAKPVRATLPATIDFIVSDLRKAIDMNVEKTKYMFNTDVARAYLARTYFWGQRWREAAELAEALLNKYPLLEGEAYKDMIQAETEAKGNVIFRSCSAMSLSGYKTSMKNAKSRPIALDFYRLFAEKKRDIRYTFFFDKKLQSSKGIHMWVRSAEMCLMLAECYVHQGNNERALKYLNDLRAKRIKDYKPLTMANLPPVDKEALVKTDATGKPITPIMQAILNERRKELFMEGDRFYELKRNGRPEFWVGVNGMKYETKKYLYTYPLAYTDLITNENLKQNPGYEDKR